MGIMRKGYKEQFIRIRDTLYPLERIIKIRKEYDPKVNMHYLAIVYKDKSNIYNDIDYFYGYEEELDKVMEEINEN